MKGEIKTEKRRFKSYVEPQLSLKFENNKKGEKMSTFKPKSTLFNNMRAPSIFSAPKMSKIATAAELYDLLLHMQKDDSKYVIKSISLDLPRTDASNKLFMKVDAETIK